METTLDPSEWQQLEGWVTQALTRIWGDSEWQMGVQTGTVILENHQFLREIKCASTLWPSHPTLEVVQWAAFTTVCCGPDSRPQNELLNYLGRGPPACQAFQRSRSIAATVPEKEKKQRQCTSTSRIEKESWHAIEGILELWWTPWRVCSCMALGRRTLEENAGRESGRPEDSEPQPWETGWWDPCGFSTEGV